MDYSTMEAGREMDRLVAEKVMGWNIEIEGGREYWNDENGRFMHGVGIENEYDDEFLHLLHWHPSESILWAWEVVEKLRASGFCFDISADERLYLAGFIKNGYLLFWNR